MEKYKLTNLSIEKLDDGTYLLVRSYKSLKTYRNVYSGGAIYYNYRYATKRSSYNDMNDLLGELRYEPDNKIGFIEKFEE